MALETEGLCVGERLKIGRRKLRIEPASGKKSANGCLKTGSGVIGKTGAAPVGTRKMKGAEQALFAEVEVIERGDESVDVGIVTVMGIGIVQMLGTVVVIGVTGIGMTMGIAPTAATIVERMTETEIVLIVVAMMTVGRIGAAVVMMTVLGKLRARGPVMMDLVVGSDAERVGSTGAWSVGSVPRVFSLSVVATSLINSSLAHPLR